MQAEEANTPRALQKARLRLQSRQQITPLPMAVPSCSTASSSAESTDCWSDMYKRFAVRVGGVLLTGMEVCERHKLEFLETLETVCSFEAKPMSEILESLTCGYAYPVRTHEGSLQQPMSQARMPYGKLLSHHSNPKKISSLRVLGSDCVGPKRVSCGLFLGGNRPKPLTLKP